MAGHYLMPAHIRGIGQEVEDEPILRIFGATGGAQGPDLLAHEQTVLSEFKFAPTCEGYRSA